MKERIKAALLGQGVGDALGVPVEFKSREYLSENPVEDMLGYMCWNQPPGTFSDDSSMMYCTAESLSNGYNLDDIGQKFVQWFKEGYWGAHFKLFDIGGTTRLSLSRIYAGVSPKYSGELFEDSNGNGSLMRILPMIFYLARKKDIQVRYEKVKEVSSITHAHFRSVFACFIFVEYGRILLENNNREVAYAEMQELIKSFAKQADFNKKEISLFDRVLNQKIWEVNIDKIRSSEYVLHALEASLFCFLTTDNYKDAVLKAVNLGEDTDTTAAITGGLAELFYGIDDIPEHWVNQLARRKDIEDLIERFSEAIDK